MTDDLPRVDSQDDMHAATSQPCAFVESMFCGTRRRQLAERVEDRTLWRCAPQWQPQQHGLAGVQRTEAEDQSGRTKVEASTSRLCSDDHVDAFSSANPRAERTAIENIEPYAAPAPTGDSEGQEDQQASFHLHRGGAGQRRNREQHQYDRGTEEIRQREPDAKRRAACMCGAIAQQRHGATSPFNWSSRAGPIPGTASSSSMDANAPCCCR